MARAVEWAIKRDSDNGGRFVSINAGRNENNYQVFQLAEAVAQAIPGTRVSINKDALPDLRSYQVDFTRYAKAAPDHQPAVSLSESITRLVDGLTSAKQAGREVIPAAAKRLTTLERLMDAGRLSDDVRWVN
ncbi:hypothetical protein D3C73_469620 [compost metagenome]